MASEKLKSSEPTPLQDKIHLHNPFTPAHISSTQTHRYLIFILTGNPGLIEYYRPFMTRLFAHLCTQQAAAPPNTVEFHVYGQSLKGFEIAGGMSSAAYRRGRWFRPFGLGEQVEWAEEKLCEAVRAVGKGVGGEKKNGESLPMRVILVGHSVGAYILLELVRRHRERLERKRKGLVVDGMVIEPNIVGGICLFPTIMDINKSVKGVRMVVSFDKLLCDFCVTTEG
jgi:pimeloyl-ACP methyl ester carboxylesterase